MNRIVPVVSFLIILLLSWEGLVNIFNIPVYLVPPPSSILQTIILNYNTIYPHVMITFWESLLGFLVGSTFGFIIAVIFVHSKILELSLYPYTIALKSVPIIAIAPLLVVWFGNGIIPKVIVSSIITFFPVIVNTVKGMKSIEQESLDLFSSLSATKKQLFFKLRLPTSLPYIFSALKISSTLSVIGAIVGEFAGSDEGLGFYILISSYRLETVDMFVGIILSSLLGIFFFYVILFAEKKFIAWGKYYYNID